MVSMSTETPRSNRADALTLVRTQSASMPSGMRAIAEAVLAEPVATVNGSAAHLAERAGVSPATVSRFARHLGYASYADLQRSMTRAVDRSQHDVTELYAGISVEDDVTTVITKVTADVAAVMRDTRAALDPAALRDAARTVGDARRVVLYGVGASGLVAEDLHHKLERIGVLSSTAHDPHNALTLASVLDERDVVVLVSHSGTTTEVLDVATEAQRRRARIVAITGHHHSVLADLAHHVLLGVAGAESDLRPAAMGSRMSQLAIVDALFIVVAQHDQDHARPLLERSREAVRPHRRQESP